MKLALICLLGLLMACGGCSRPQPPIPPDQQLLTAVQQGDAAAIQAAIDAGADPNSTAMGPDSLPLFLAAKSGKLELAKALIEKGANANHPGAISPGDIHTFKQGIPLNAATAALDLPMVQLLIEHGADVNAEWENAGGINTPLQAAIGATLSRSPAPPVSPQRRQAAVEIVKLLIEKGAKPTKPEYGENLPPLQWAARNGDLTLVQWLVAQGYDVKSTTWDGYNTLHQAAASGNVALLKWLLAQHVDIETANANGWSPLYFAVSGGHAEAVKFLLEEAGCNVNGSPDPQTAHLGTPLHVAVVSMQDQISRQLIDAGADLSLRNKAGLTPLGQALAQMRPGQPYSLDVIKLLKSLNAPE